MMNDSNKVIKTIYDTYIKMLELSDELNMMQKAYNSRMLNPEKEYEGKMYNAMQYKEIMTGLDDGLDVSLYASPDLSYMSMSMIRAAIQSGADVKEIVNPNKKFNEKQIALLCSAAISGLYDIERIAYSHLDTDRMFARITGDYIRADMPDRTVSVEGMKEYGYMSDEMLPLGKEAAFFYYDENLPVMLLYPNGTEAYPDNMEDMSRHAEHSGMFGMEKYVWERELNKADEKQDTDMAKFSDILKEGSTYYAIYQIKDEADERLNILFRNKEDIDSRGIPVDFENYKLVYAEETLPRLESIYQQFNTTYADGFYGHSLSVSDVIVLKDGGSTSAYYVDSIGFKEVPEFAIQFCKEKELILEVDNRADMAGGRSEKTFAEQVDEVIAGVSNQYDALKVCDTPQILLDVGCEQLPMLYTQQHLRDALKDKSQENPHRHGLTVEQIKAVPELLKEPALICDTLTPHERSNKSIVVVLCAVDNEKAPLIVSVLPNGKGVYNLEMVDANFITSIYGKDRGFEKYMNKVIASSSVLYCDKEKSQKLFMFQGLQLPEAFNNLDFNIIIRKSNNIVNTKVHENEEKDATLPKPETKTTAKKPIR